MAEEEPKPNEEVKDSLFADLFGRDRTAKENFISLYNALNGTALKPEETELIPETLDNVMYMSIHNDVAMRVNGKVVVLVEHQSSINRNMPLRLLSYIARTYERIVPARKKYYRGIVKVPMPEFYVMYNGTDDYPEKDVMRLSDAFLVPEGETPAEMPLELVVSAYNINPGKGDALLGRCEVLRQYSALITLVREAMKDGKADPLKRAVMEAMRRGILPDYLERKSSEVINMLTMEYNYADDVAAQREESLAEGLRIGEEKGLRIGEEKGRVETIKLMMGNMNLTFAQVMDALKIEPPERDRLEALLQ